MVEIIAKKAPVKHYEVESCVIAECFQRNLQKFQFFPNGKKEIVFSFKLAEAFAMNVTFANTKEYNVFVRPKLEPHLPVCKGLENS